MDFNDDDNESSTPTAKPTFKFQPKAKAKLKARAPPLKKAIPAAKPAVPQHSADPGNEGIVSPISLQETTNLQVSSSAELLLSSMENLSAITTGHIEETDNPKENANQPFPSGDLMIEAVQGFAGLESLDEILPQSTVLEDATFNTSNSHNEQDMLNGTSSFPSPFLQKETLTLETQEVQVFTSSDFTSDIGPSSGKKSSNFQPKLKKKQGKKSMANESSSDPKQTLVSPSETQNTNEGSFDEGIEGLLNRVGSIETSPDNTTDPPSCTDATTDCFVNQESELPQSSSGFIHDNSSQQDASLSADIHLEPVHSVSEAENNNGHCKEKAGPKKRKPSNKSKTDKDPSGGDQPVRKRKKATEASAKSKEQPPKKFPHSTRRRNRTISKSLLETPEDEIDHLSLPIKDLIMLAEHRERQNKVVDTRPTTVPVEEVTAPVAEPVNRTNNNFWEDNPYEDDEADEYNSGQAEDSFGNPSTSTATTDSAYFNYHSHMDKTPRVKWTKQDTELFYEGLRQFGSDLSMIQHLFPGRTRHQIKLKYKKEERQQPVKLLEALTNRSKDLSHYKLVIGRLQEQIDREEEQQRAEEEALGATGNEGNPEEATPDDTKQEQTQDEAAKSDHDGDGIDVEDPNTAKIGSPTAWNDELDIDDWSAYKSDL